MTLSYALYNLVIIGCHSDSHFGSDMTFNVLETGIGMTGCWSNPDRITQRFYNHGCKRFFLKQMLQEDL